MKQALFLLALPGLADTARPIQCLLDGESLLPLLCDDVGESKNLAKEKPLLTQKLHAPMPTPNNGDAKQGKGKKKKNKAGKQKGESK